MEEEDFLRDSKRVSGCMMTRAAAILLLLGNDTIQFNTRIKTSELDIHVKSTTKLDFP